MNEIEKDEDMLLVDETEEKKVEKKNIAFSTSDKGKDNPLSKTSREDFENIEKNLMKIMHLNTLLIK